MSVSEILSLLISELESSDISDFIESSSDFFWFYSKKF